MNVLKVSDSVIDFVGGMIFLNQAKQLNLCKNISVSFVEKYWNKDNCKNSINSPCI